MVRLSRSTARVRSLLVLATPLLATACPDVGPVQQSEECRQYLECQAAVDAVTGSQTAGIESLYGPDGSCWSDALQAASCTTGCAAAIETAQDTIDPLPVQCGGDFVVPDGGLPDDGGTDDAGPAPDGGAADAGTSDGGAADAGSADAGAVSACATLSDSVVGVSAPRSHPVLLAANVARGAQVADVNGDGALDVVLVAATSHSAQVVLGDGAGGFTNLEQHATGNNPTEIELALVDGDAHLDLLVLEEHVDTITMFPGNGDGTFGAGVSRAGFIGPSQYSVGDLDDDGDLDLFALVGGSQNGRALVALGEGDGTFAAPVQQLALGAWVTGSELIDADEDGDLDAIYGEGAGNVRVALNDGTGAFTVGSTIDTALDDVARIVVHDLDGDGHQDIVMTAAASGVAVRYGDGGGGFVDEQDLSQTRGIQSAAVTDVTGDGMLDLVFAANGTFGDRGLLVIPATGPRTFGEGQMHTLGDRFANVVFTGDFDSDGRTDVGLAMRDNVSSAHSLELFFGCAD